MRRPEGRRATIVVMGERETPANDTPDFSRDRRRFAFGRAG